jgi:hypothetical protein
MPPLTVPPIPISQPLPQMLFLFTIKLLFVIAKLNIWCVLIGLCYTKEMYQFLFIFAPLFAPIKESKTTKPLLSKGFKIILAEGKGFEPLIGFLLYTLSRRASSTTPAPLLKGSKNTV